VWLLAIVFHLHFYSYASQRFPRSLWGTTSMAPLLLFVCWACRCTIKVCQLNRPGHPMTSSWVTWPLTDPHDDPEKEPRPYSYNLANTILTVCRRHRGAASAVFCCLVYPRPGQEQELDRVCRGYTVVRHACHLGSTLR